MRQALFFAIISASCLILPSAAARKASSSITVRGGAVQSLSKIRQRVRGDASSPKSAVSSKAGVRAANKVDAHHHGLTIPALAVNIMADLCPHGMLPLAYGMASEGGTGLLPALLLLFTFGTLSAYTLVSIARACEETGSYSFRTLWSQILSPGTAWIIDSAITFLCFGCCIFYASFIGDLSSALAQALGAPAFFQKRWVTLVMLHVFPLLPLSLMRNLSALQYSSIVGVLGILYTTAFVIKRLIDGSYFPGGYFHNLIETFYRPSKASHSSLERVFRLGPGAVSLMNMACVAFTTHYNGISYYQELQDRSLPRYSRAVTYGFLASFTVFALMMTFGYQTFGLAAQPLLLNNYHRTTDYLATGSRLATAFSIICGFPLMFAGLKTGFFSLWNINISESTRLSLDVRQALLSSRAINLLSTLLLASICGIACQCSEEEVGFVIGLIGAVLGTGVVYFIPALLNTRLLSRSGDIKRRQPERKFNYGLMATGTLFAVLGSYAALEEQGFIGKGLKAHLA